MKKAYIKVLIGLAALGVISMWLISVFDFQDYLYELQRTFDSLIRTCAAMGVNPPVAVCVAFDYQKIIPLVAADFLIFLSYISIPFSIYSYVLRRDDLKGWLLTFAVSFISFIVLCGLTHLFSVIGVFVPNFINYEIVMKVLTTLVSVLVAFIIMRYGYVISDIPSRAELIRDKQINEVLQVANNVGVWHFYFENRKAHWSPYMFEIFERRRGDGIMEENEIDKYIYPDDLEKVHNHRRAAERGETYTLFFRIITNGKIKRLKAETYTDQNVMYGDLVDVTEVSDNIENLELENQRLKAENRRLKKK